MHADLLSLTFRDASKIYRDTRLVKGRVRAQTICAPAARDCATTATHPGTTRYDDQMAPSQQPPPPSRPDPDAARRAAQLHHAMSKAPAGSKERRFLRRAAERARARARAGE